MKACSICPQPAELIIQFKTEDYPVCRKCRDLLCMILIKAYTGWVN